LQVTLNQASQFYTFNFPFASPPFAMKSALEEFQEAMSNLLEHIEGAEPMLLLWSGDEMLKNTTSTFNKRLNN